MWIAILSLIAIMIAFLDYCILRFSGEQDRELSDQMQQEFLENYRKHHK